MNPWLETLAVVLLALLGIFLGRAFGRLREPYWVLGYFFSFVFIMVLVVAGFSHALNFLPPFSWITAGRVKFVVLSLAVTMGLTTPVSHLPYKFEKITVCILMAVVVIWFCIFPFLVPALIKEDLLALETRVDSRGTCFQSRAYTCGPAAAVTALLKLGLPACEGELAVLSHSSPVAGTLPQCLCKAIQNRYAAEGLKCRYRQFNSVVQLKGNGVVLAVVKDTFLSDHCVAVLEVSDQMIVVADPVIGTHSMSHKQFEKIWRFAGIVLQRDYMQNI